MSNQDIEISGPPYPEPLQFRSNIIGKFATGKSPVGTIIPFYYWDTIISQYANSPIIDQLVGLFDAYIDQTYNMDTFYDDIWNVTTAQGYGLDVWGRIVGVTRVVTTTQGEFFGFDEQIPTVQPFGPGGVGCFYSGGLASTNFSLADKSFRQLIYAKAMANITNGSVASINAILRSLFPGAPGNAYVTDGGNMTMQYTFNFALTAVQLAIVTQSGVLPRSAGVSATVVQVF